MEELAKSELRFAPWQYARLDLFFYHYRYEVHIRHEALGESGAVREVKS